MSCACGCGRCGKPGGAGCGPLEPLALAVRRDAAVWSLAARTLAALTSPVVGLNLWTQALEVGVAALIGGCTVRGGVAALAAAQVQQADILIGLDTSLGGNVVPFIGLVRMWRNVMAKAARGIAPTSSEIAALTGAMVQVIDDPAAASRVSSSSSGGSTVVSRIFRPSNSIIKAQAFTDAINGSTSSPLRDVGALASVLLSAAQVTADVRGARFDLRPDLTREVTRILDDVAAYRVHLGGPAAMLKKWDGVTATTRAYLEDILRSPMPSPWGLESVVEVLNDPQGATSPIDGGDRVPVVDVIDRGRSGSGGGGGGGAVLGLGALAILGTLLGGR